MPVETGDNVFGILKLMILSLWIIQGVYPQEFKNFIFDPDYGKYDYGFVHKTGRYLWIERRPFHHVFMPFSQDLKRFQEA